MKSKYQHEDRTVLALLYDAYRRTYPETVESLQREIESLYRDLYQQPLTDPEGVTAVFVGLCDDRARFAYEQGIRVGVQLALDLELDSVMGGAAECF